MKKTFMTIISIMLAFSFNLSYINAEETNDISTLNTEVETTEQRIEDLETESVDDETDEDGSEDESPDHDIEETVTQDDTKDIQALLNEARDQETYTEDNPLVIHLTNSKYYITKTLYIYSNTHLIVDDDTTIEMVGSYYWMVVNRHFHSDGTEGTGGISCENQDCGGYNQGSNITIEGGTWIQQKGETRRAGIFSFRHSNNVTIKNMDVYHTTSHFFNFSGSKDATVDHVGFHDGKYYTGIKDNSKSVCECVHFDYTNTIGEDGVYPSDNTPCINSTVENCTFDNVCAGVGNHHNNSDARHTNLVIRNNTFTNLMGFALDVYSVDGVILENNTVEGNTVSAIRAQFSTDMVVKNNTFKDINYTDTYNLNRQAISITACTGTISNNTIDGTPKCGIRIGAGSTLTVTGNKIRNCGMYGIYISKSYYDVSALNTINLTKNSLGEIDYQDGMCMKIAGLVNSTVCDNRIDKKILLGTSISKTTVKNNGINMKNMNIDLSYQNITYNGKANKPTVTVSDDFDVVDPTYYKISYSNNKYPGTATVKVTGISDNTHTGFNSKSTTFSVDKLKQDITTTDYSGTYDAKKHTISISGVKSKSTVKYSTDKKKWTTTKPTRTSAGTTTVYYKITKTYYETVTGSNTITINKADLTKANLSCESYSYTGKNKTPSVTAYADSLKLSSSNYTVTYPKSRKNVGTYTVTITGKSSATGTVTKEFVINPVGTKLSSVKADKGYLTVKWNKQSKQTPGYEIQYSSSSKFDTEDTASDMVDSYKTTSYKIENLTSKQKYYVRIRTYKTVGEKTYYSSWSKALYATVK